MCSGEGHMWDPVNPRRAVDYTLCGDCPEGDYRTHGSEDKGLRVTWEEFLTLVPGQVAIAAQVENMEVDRTLPSSSSSSSSSSSPAVNVSSVPPTPSTETEAHFKAAHNHNLEVLRGEKLCSCINLFDSSSCVHTQEEHDTVPGIMKMNPDECDVVEHENLTVCMFCSYSITDDGHVFRLKTHRHEHFRTNGGKIVGAHKYTQVARVGTRQLVRYIFLTI